MLCRVNEDSVIICCMILVVHFLPQVVMGLAYSVLASALWPMVALIIPENQLGTAYGM